MALKFTAILKSKIETTANIADRLAFSIAKATNLGLVPLSVERIKVLSDEDMEVIDACLFRYGSLISNIQDSMFKAIGDIENEQTTTMSNRDKTNLMERIGALPSAEEFSQMAVLRNKLMHNYPEEMQKHLMRINAITSEVPKLLEIFVGIAKYAEKFGIAVSMEEFKHLAIIRPLQ